METRLRDVIDNYELACSTIRQCNYLVYYGDEIEEMCELVKSIWGENSLSILHHIEPGSTDNLIPHLQRASARTIGYICDKEYKGDPIQQTHQQTLKRYETFLPTNAEQFQIRNRNYLRNWKYLKNSIKLQECKLGIPVAIIWGASPGLDDVLEEIEKNNLWENVNNCFNIVVDSALPRLAKTPLQIDVVSSLDALPIKGKSTIENMPKDCLYHFAAGTNHRIIDAIDNQYFLEIDNEANYIYAADSECSYRVSSSTSNVALFAYWFLKRYIQPEITLLVGCECCYRDNKTHSNDVQFENQADKAGGERVKIKCLDGEERETHEFLRQAADSFREIIDGGNVFNATLQAAGFAERISISNICEYTAENPFPVTIDWQKVERTNYDTYEKDFNELLKTLKKRKRILNKIKKNFDKRTDSKSRVSKFACSQSSIPEFIATSFMMSYDYYSYSVFSEILKTGVRKRDDKTREDNIKLYYKSFLNHYLKSLKYIIGLMKGMK